MNLTRRHRPAWALAFALAAAAAPAFAQGAAAEVPHNVVTLTASASAEVMQDRLSMLLAVTRDGSDAAAVQTQLKSVLDAALTEARTAARAGGFEVRTGAFSLYPRYGKDGRINGWQGRAELVLEGRDIARISATAGKLTGLTVAQVNFSLSREERQRAESALQAEAIERFRARAGEIARGFGFNNFGLREVAVNTEDSGRNPPMPRMVAMAARAEAADAPVPVEAGRSTVTVTVSGSVQLR